MEDGIYRFSNNSEQNTDTEGEQGETPILDSKSTRPAESAPAGDLPPKKNRRRRKKRRNAGIIPAILLMLFAVAAMVGAVYVYLKYDDEQKKNAELNKQIAALYTKEQVESAKSEASAVARQELIDYIQSTLSSEDTGPLDTIRTLFPDQIVLGYRGNYNFVPIDASLPKSTFSKTDFKVDDKGRVQYVGTDPNVKTSFGIDVSAHQGNIDWKAVKADGVDFAFIRAGFRGWGTNATFNKDDRFEYNVKEAYSNGIAVGVYWVTHALDTADVEQELNYLYEIIDPYRYMITYPLVFDLEQPETEENRIWNLSKEQHTANSQYFLSAVKEKGYTPMFYGNLTSFAMMVDPAVVCAYPTWYAWYSVPLYFPYEFNVWQYSANGRVNGIANEVDLNLMVKPF